MPARALVARTFVLLLFAALASVASLAAAQAPAGSTFVVMEAVGRSLMLVERGRSVGTRINKDSRETVKPAGSGFNESVVIAAREAMKRHLPAATAGDAYFIPAEVAKGFFTSGGVPADGPTVSARLREAAGAQSAEHILLVLPQPARDWENGSRVQGLGVYADRSARDLSGEVTGYVAPFAYLRVLLLRGNDFAMLADTDVRLYRKRYLERTIDSSNPWTAYTPEELGAMLDVAVREALDIAVEKIARQVGGRSEAYVLQERADFR